MKKLEKKNKGGLWNATFGELIATFQILEKNGFTLEMLKQLREKGGEEKAKKIVAIFLGTLSTEINYEALKTDWQNFYAKYFFHSVNLSAVKIPTPIKGFNRLLIIIPGIFPNHVVIAQRRCFKTVVFTEDPHAEDLNKAISHNDRDALNGPYAIWVHDTIEPDQKYLGRSAVWAKANQISGETLLESLIHGLKYWDEKKKHLNIKRVMVCIGSHDSEGNVPIVSFYLASDRVTISWSRPDRADDCHGLREVVSCVRYGLQY